MKENVKKSKKRAPAKGHADENCKPTKRRKLDPSEKHEKKSTNKPISSIQKTINLVASPSSASLKTDSEANASHPTKDPVDPDDPKVLKTPGKITAFTNTPKRSDSVCSSSSEVVPLAKLKDKILSRDAVSATTVPIKQFLSHSSGGSGKKRPSTESPQKQKSDVVGSASKVSLDDDEVPLVKLRDKLPEKDAASVSLPVGQSPGSSSGKKKSTTESPRKPKVSADVDSIALAKVKRFLDDNDDSSFDVPLAKLRDERQATGDAGEPALQGTKKSSSLGGSGKKKNVLGKGKGSGLKSSSVILYRLASPKPGSSKKDALSTSSPKKKVSECIVCRRGIWGTSRARAPNN